MSNATSLTRGRHRYDIQELQPGNWRVTIEGDEHFVTRDPQRICLARKHDGSGLCEQWSEENGRCKFHGGASLSGPDHPRWVTGQRSGAAAKLKGRLGEIAQDLQGAEGIDDAALVTRTLLAFYLEHTADEELLRDSSIRAVMALVKELRACVESIEAQRRERWLSPEEIRLFQAHIVGVAQQFVPAEKWSEFMKALSGGPPQVRTRLERE